MTGDDAVLYAASAGVATITMNRPESRNRLSLEAMSSMSVMLARAAADDDVRVVVLTGTGSAFCAGADMSAALSADGRGFTGPGPAALVELMTAMLDHPKPIIARVQGHVAGGGNGLVAACDIAVASSDARFAFSEVRIGLAPAVISVVCLAVMHRRDAQELLLTGERVDAERVRQAGLVTRVVAADGLDTAVEDYVRMLQAGGPMAVSGTKRLLATIPTLPRAEAFDAAASMSAELFASDEGREGMTAFLEKRRPAWLAGS